MNIIKEELQKEIMIQDSKTEVIENGTRKGKIFN